MNEFGLDLAVIGNGQTAALLEPASRLVWWCFPRFDGDPVFSRLLAGDEEKGFCDVVLDDMVDFSSDYERNTRHCLDGSNQQPRLREDHGFCATLSQL